MNKYVSIALLLTACVTAQCQQYPVHWHLYSKKIANRTFELHFNAVIDRPWHIYSGENDVAVTQPTLISFSKNPLVDLRGKITEVGELRSEKLEPKGVLKFYEAQVEFVQVVKLKGDVKINISGDIEYMACVTGRCLEPQTLPFQISVDNSIAVPATMNAIKKTRQ